jgi:hypothetical protein
MADSAVPALVRKPAELARGIEAAKGRLRELPATLGHVDATIRLVRAALPNRANRSQRAAAEAAEAVRAG